MTDPKENEKISMPQVKDGEIALIHMRMIHPPSPYCPFCKDSYKKRVHLTPMQLTKPSKIQTSQPQSAEGFLCENCQTIYERVEDDHLAGDS